MCQNIATVMMQLSQVYSEHKLTLTGIATAIFHGYDSGEQQIKYVIESHNYILHGN